MPSTTAGHIFEKAACKYCSAEVSVNSLARHEADCMNASDELREQRKRSRENAEAKRRRNAQPQGTKHKQRTEECEFCHDDIGAGSIVRHRVKCANQTPQEREYAKSQRAYQAKFYATKNEKAREKYRASVRIPTRTASLDKPVVPDSYQQHYAAGDNGTKMNKPMSISMLVDEEDFALALGKVVISKLPELLPQLIPGLKIDAFATKHVYGPRPRHKN